MGWPLHLSSEPLFHKDSLYGTISLCTSLQELMDELGIYFLLFDRAGYGESDPNPKRSVKSEASDIAELADQLELGPKFYVMGVSLGCYPVGSCLKRLPHRLELTSKTAFSSCRAYFKPANFTSIYDL